jgi:tetratricopeptide (TPR) repeat protein
MRQLTILIILSLLISCQKHDDTTKKIKTPKEAALSDSLPYYLKSLGSDHKNPFFLRGLGRAYLTLDSDQKAIDYYKKSFFIDPDDEISISELAQIYQMRGAGGYAMTRICEKAEKINYVKRHGSEDEYDDEILWLKWKNNHPHNNQQFLDSAIFYSELLSKIRPEKEYPLMLLSTIYENDCRPVSALKCLLKAIQLDSNNLRLYDYAGELCTDGSAYTKALFYYDKALALNPNDAETYFDLGRMYYFEKNYQKAVEEFDEEIKLKPEVRECPTTAYSHEYKGLIFAKIGAKESALREYHFLDSTSYEDEASEIDALLHPDSSFVK